MTTTRSALALLLAAPAVLLAGCATGDQAEGGSMDIESVAGSTFSSTAEGDPHISFAEDGTFEAFDGCNGFTGSYSVADDALALEREGFATQKGCPGVDTWLRTADTVQLNDDELVVFDESGEQLGVLSRD